MGANDEICFARMLEQGEAAVEHYENRGIDTSEPTVMVAHGEPLIERLRAAGLHDRADDVERMVDDLRAFGHDGKGLIVARWWADGCPQVV